MLTKGPAKKVTIYINEESQHHMMALHDSIMNFLMHKGIGGATATRAFSGFGSHQMLHTLQAEVVTQHLPIRIEFVESAEKVEEVLPSLYEMVSDGLIEVQDTQVIKNARKMPRPEPRLPHKRQEGPAKLLRVFIGEADKWHGAPLYDAIVQKLRMMDVAGATVIRGILGYGAKGHAHKKSFFHVSARYADHRVGDRHAREDRRGRRGDRGHGGRQPDRRFRCRHRAAGARSIRRGGLRCKRHTPLRSCAFTFPNRTAIRASHCMKRLSRSAVN